MRLHILAAGLLLGALAGPASAQEDPEAQSKKKPQQDLTEMSLEDLMKVDITSVSKREQPLMDAPAAVTVIRGDDLRRTGATSIPESLRLVPGLFVGHVDANKWVVGSRGFSDLFSDKLLVLIDGRSVYSPLFSGVFWTVQDVALEDVDRIEVIRGPGATVWGANAVNGVINIITKKAKDTQGGLVSGGGGSSERAFGTVRYGGKINEDLYYRVYAKSFVREGLPGRQRLLVRRPGRLPLRLDPPPRGPLHLPGGLLQPARERNPDRVFPPRPLPLSIPRPTPRAMPERT